MKHVEEDRWDDSDDDGCKTKFIKTLLRYDYVYENEFKLNLPEKEKCSFLKDCREFIPSISENDAVIKIMELRELYIKERTSLEKNSRNANDSKSPWFLLADKLFRRESERATAKTSISMPLKQRMKSSSYSQSSVDSGEKLSKSHERSSFSSGVRLDAQTTSKVKKKIPRRSQSLPDTCRIPVPTIWFCLGPPTPNTEAIQVSSSSKSNSDFGCIPAIIGNSLAISTSSPPTNIDSTSPTSTRFCNLPSSPACLSPNAGASISPVAGASISYKTRASISPSTGASVTPATGVSISPITTRSSISPITARSSISPITARSSISPATARSSISPATARSSISPATRAMTSPATRAMTSPATRAMTSPATRATTSPATRVTTYPLSKQISFSPFKEDSSPPSKADGSSSSKGDGSFNFRRTSVIPSSFAFFPERVSASPSKRTFASLSDNASVSPSDRGYASPSKRAYASPSEIACASPSEVACASPSEVACASPSEVACASPSEVACASETSISPDKNVPTSLASRVSFATSPTVLNSPVSNSKPSIATDAEVSVSPIVGRSTSQNASDLPGFKRMLSFSRESISNIKQHKTT